MTKKSKYRPYLIRLWIVLAISLVASLGINEIAYNLGKDEYDRAPDRFQIVIPNGTAKKVAAGEQAVEIPEEMVFVLGDVLEVKNEDVVNHQLGPIWVPPGSTGKLVMERAQKYSIACSFQTDRLMGLDVRQATTLGTRLTALGLVAPTTAALMYLYSLLLFPINKKKDGNDLARIQP